MGECRDCAYSDRPTYKWPCSVCRATKNGRSMYCPEESDNIANDEGKTDYISRWEAQDAMTGENLIRNLDSVENGEAKRYARAAIRVLERLKPADVRPVPPGGIVEMSDGYHTFHGLYYQRMVLFAALVKQNKDSAWKSHRHEDGELCFGGGWFIVGIDTPDGSYTYHYEDKDWDLFDCEELPVCKHWDGHTEDDVTRLLSLPDVRPAWRSTETDLPKIGEPVLIARKIRYRETVLVEPAVLRPDGTWKAISHKIKPSSVRYWMPMPEPPKESEI